VLLVASAPNYPHGIVDDIPKISRLATEHGIPMHVDCCLGSLIIAFLKKSGFPSPYESEGGFDFRQPGVTSISVDTHKYAFAPKGSSVLLYRNRSYRNYQYFLFPDWSGGAYASPSMAGSRPGSLIAGAWATLMKMGEAGYINSCQQIVGAAKKFETTLLTNPILKSHIGIIGHPLASVVAFTSKNDEIETYDIADAMDARGWHLNALQSPPAIHCAFTIPTAKAVDGLISDLIEVITEIAFRIEERKVNGKQSVRQSGKSAVLYGVGGSIADMNAVSQFAEGFLDTLYQV
jgi:sphinganine-1-phosphate aldolase